MGDIIRRVRESLPETQDELSFRAHVSQGWLSQVELGHIANPSTQRVRAIAAALGVDARVLFAAQFDIPFGDGAVARVPRDDVPNDPIALAEQIAVLTDRLARIAAEVKARDPERRSRTSAGA